MSPKKGLAVPINFNRKNTETGEVNTMQDLAFRDDFTPRIMAEGGAGSGKTYLLAMKLLKLSMQNRGIPGGVLCPDYAMFKRDVLEVFQEIGEKNNFSIPYNSQGKFFTFPWGGHKLWVFSADTKFPGANLGWGGVNEHSITPKDKLEEFVERRVRLRCPIPQIILAGTPDDPFGYIEEITKKWEELNLGDLKLPVRPDQQSLPILKIYRGSAMMNSHNLKLGYIEEKRRTLDEMAFRLWVLGERVILNTEAFYYAMNNGINKEVKRQKGQLVHACMDFNVDNMHCELAHTVGMGNYKEFQFFDEIVLKDKGADTDALCKALKIWNGDTVDGILITCDASVKARRTSGRADVDVIKNHGFEVRFSAANPRMRERQLRANGLLANKRIAINKEKCPVLWNDLLRCAQDKMTFEKKKDKKGIFSHASDGMDYLLSHEVPDLDLTGRQKFRVGKQNASI